MIFVRRHLPPFPSYFRASNCSWRPKCPSRTARPRERETRKARPSAGTILPGRAFSCFPFVRRSRLLIKNRPRIDQHVRKQGLGVEGGSVENILRDWSRLRSAGRYRIFRALENGERPGSRPKFPRRGMRQGFNVCLI